VTGVALADGAIKIEREKHWPTEETWLLICGTPIIAKGPGTLEDVLVNFIATGGEGAEHSKGAPERHPRL